MLWQFIRATADVDLKSWIGRRVLLLIPIDAGRYVSTSCDHMYWLHLTDTFFIPTKEEMRLDVEKSNICHVPSHDLNVGSIYV